MPAPVAGTVVAWFLAAVPPEEPNPPYRQLRYDEDYTYLQDPARRLDFFDPIKYVPFGGTEGRYLSVGGEVRPYFEFFRNEEWGAVPGDNGYLLQRYMLHVDVHWNERIRVFGQLKNGIETGRRGGPRPVDEDKLDLHQAFLDVTLLSSSAGSLTLRAGRQEMSFGHQRLVNFREGPNVRLSFDGPRATFQTKAWQVWRGHDVRRPMADTQVLTQHERRFGFMEPDFLTFESVGLSRVIPRSPDLNSMLTLLGSRDLASHVQFDFHLKQLQHVTA